MGKTQHSGFAQFANADLRKQFVRALRATDAELTERAYLSGSQPTIVFENLSPKEFQEVVLNLEGRGRWIEDVQFETTN